MRPFTKEEIEWFRLRAICRSDHRDFVFRAIPPPAIYWRIISLVTDMILKQKP